MSNKTFISQALKLLLLAFLSISCASCKDNEEDIITYYDTYVEGYIKDFHTGQPISGVVFDANYYYGSNGGLFGTDPYFAENVATSNSEGYYRIKIPKHGDLGSSQSSVDFNAIRILPRNTQDYSFKFGDFIHSTDSLTLKNKRVDITPVTYGYLKVIMPKDYSENWSINPWETSTYEKPFYKGKFVEKQLFNTDYKLLLFKVPLEKTRFSYGDNYIHDFDFTINNPRDTVTINVEQK